MRKNVSEHQISLPLFCEGEAVLYQKQAGGHWHSAKVLNACTDKDGEAYYKIIAESKVYYIPISQVACQKQKG